MMDIWSATRTALTGLELPMAANQYMAATGAEIPDTFLVYQLVTSPAQQHADDAETLRSYLMRVTYYSRDGLSTCPDIKNAMVAAGFSRGEFRELPYFQETRHFGLSFDFNYLDEE